MSNWFERYLKSKVQLRGSVQTSPAYRKREWRNAMQLAGYAYYLEYELPRQLKDHSE